MASSFSKKKSNNNSQYHPFKYSKQPKISIINDGNCTFVWSNLAFISDNEENDKCLGVAGWDDNIKMVCSPTILSSENNKKQIRKDYFNMQATEEEMRIRDELAKEIEKELEREIMDGITVIVRRLSDLKAKQILAKGLWKDQSRLDQFISEIGNISSHHDHHDCNFCNADDHTI